MAKRLGAIKISARVSLEYPRKNFLSFSDEKVFIFPAPIFKAAMKQDISNENEAMALVASACDDPKSGKNPKATGVAYKYTNKMQKENRNRRQLLKATIANQIATNRPTKKKEIAIL